MDRLSMWVQSENGLLLHWTLTEGWPWENIMRGNPTMGRVLGDTHGHSLCDERKEIWGENIGRHMGSGKWLGWSTGDLEKKDGYIKDKEVWGQGRWLDVQAWAGREKNLLLHVSVHQRALTMEEALNNQRSIMAWCQPAPVISQSSSGNCSWMEQPCRNGSYA